MCLMFDTLTLLIKPLMLFFKASQAMRWYSFEVLSVICAWSAFRRAGGMYVPPDRMLSSFSYSAFAAACFSSPVRGFAGAASSRCRSSSWRFRSCARSLSTSRGSGSLRRGGERDREYDLRRSDGASRRGEGEREGGARLRELLSGAVSSPSTEGERATDAATVAISDATLIRPFAPGCVSE
jgi:hypothetical protein